MRARDLIDLLSDYDPDDEVEIEIYETMTGKYVDSTAAVSIGSGAFPTLKIDVEAGKFKKFT